MENFFQEPGSKTCRFQSILLGAAAHPLSGWLLWAAGRAADVQSAQMTPGGSRYARMHGDKWAESRCCLFKGLWLQAAYFLFRLSSRMGLLCLVLYEKRTHSTPHEPRDCAMHICNLALMNRTPGGYCQVVHADRDVPGWHGGVI